MSAPAPSLSPVAAVTSWLAAASLVFVQRQPVLRALVLADVCPVPANVLLLGPPGTAKTAVTTGYARAAAHVTCARTLSPWTDDAALLGSVDLALLAKGILARTGVGYLPDAGFVFLDELPRAGRGVRDLVLSALADRITPDGVRVAAHVIVAAANTRLVDDDDRALVDRFALRVEVPRVTGADLRSVIGRSVPVDGVAPAHTALPLLPAGAIEALRARAFDVSMPGAVLDALKNIAEVLRTSPPSGQRHPDVSERRWIIATRLLQASAVLADRDVVTYDDLLTTLPLILDDGEDAQAAIRNAITSSIPAWIAALADVRKACDDAITLARRIEVDRAPVSPTTAQQHSAREKTLTSMAQALTEHGDDARRAANALVTAALDACDDAVTEGLTARKTSRKPKN